MKVSALIVCAGRGTRMGPGAPKQYRQIGGQAVLHHTARAFLSHPDISDVTVVIHPDDRALYAAAVAGLALRPPVIGGATRDHSVRLGLEALASAPGGPPDAVLIHDGVRPFVTPETLSATVAALAEHGAVIAAMPVFDTIKQVAEGRVTATIDRAILWRAQTPQGFRFPLILEAHRQVAGLADRTPITDDASVAEALDIPVRIVPGSEDAFKITTEADLRRAERHLRGDE